MHKLMVLQDGEACDGEYAAKLDSLLKEMNKNKYASEDMAINLDEQFKVSHSFKIKGQNRLQRILSIIVSVIVVDNGIACRDDAL